MPTKAQLQQCSLHRLTRVTQHEQEYLYYDKSAASLYRKVAAWVLDIFCNFYLVKNHKIANDSTTAQARGNVHRFRILRNLEKKIDAGLTKLKNNQILIE